ncbi:MAG: DUF222 domain-containing protein [Microbacteriaceae bacterium]
MSPQQATTESATATATDDTATDTATEIATAARCLCALSRADIAAGSDAELIAMIRGAAELGRLVDAVRVAAVRQLDARCGPGAEPRLDTALAVTGPAEALEALTLGSRTDAGRLLRLARATAPRLSLTGQSLPVRYPAVAAALADGALGIEAAAAIVDALATAEPRAVPEDLCAAEAALVDAASRQPVALLAPQLRLWVQAIDQDGIEPRYRAQRRARFLRLSPQADGMTRITGLADPETATRLKAALGPCSRRGDGPVFRPSERLSAEEPPAGGLPVGGLPVGAVIDDRTPGQRLLDRLTETVEAGADALHERDLRERGRGRAPRRYRRERIVLTATLDDFETGRGVAQFLGTDTVVPIRLLRERVAAGAQLETLLFAGNGRVLARGRKRRFSRGQRIALQLRDGGCCARLGCTRPAEDCDAHHVIPWSAGGQTDVDNGVHQCAGHHWLAHNAGGVLTMIDGVPHYQPPLTLGMPPQRLGRPRAPALSRSG